MERRQTPFSVNVFGQKLAYIALDDLTFLKKTCTYVQNERQYLEYELEKLGFLCIPSDSNYLLVDVSNKYKSVSSWIKKLNEHNVNVINGKDFKLPQYVRISPRLHEINMKFVEVLTKIN